MSSGVILAKIATARIEIYRSLSCLVIVINETEESSEIEAFQGHGDFACPS